MADILISKFTTQIPRVGATPATPGFAESEGQDPVAPSGTPIQYGIGAGLSLDSLNQIQLGKAGPFFQLVDLKEFESGGVSRFGFGYDDSIFFEDFIYSDKTNDDLQKSLTLSSITNYRVNEAYYANTFNAEYILNVRNGSSLRSYNFRFFTQGISSIASFTDDINEKGLEYTADYESNFTARSLVTKQYVDGAISGAGHNPVTIGSPANGLSISGTQVLTIGLASTSATGALSSTDWNTFNNKQNALTNPVTGTGISGQVAFWNGTTTQTGSNNLFWDNVNGRLGVGTNAPTHPLHVITTVADIGILLESTTNPAFILRRASVNRLILTAGGNIGTVNGLGNGLNIQTDGTTRISILSGGNVGIGNITATNTLDVNGTARIRTISNLGTAATSVLVPSATGVVSLRTATEFLADAGGISGTIASGQVAFGTGVNTVGGDSGMRYANTSGNSTLTIQGTGTGQSQIISLSNNGLVSLSILTNNSGNFVTSTTSLVFRARSSGIIEFQTTDSNTLRWFITNGGNLTAANGNTINTTNNGNLIIAPNGTGLVMIGSGTPTNLLDVNGTARIRTISNLGVSATNVLVPDATGVLSLRTISELASDLGAVTLTGTQTITGAKTFNNSLLVQSGSNPVFRIATTDNTAIVNFRNVFSEDAAGIEMSTPSNELAIVTRVSNKDIRIQPNGTGKIKLPNVPTGTGDVLGRDASNNLVRITTLSSYKLLDEDITPTAFTSTTFASILTGGILGTNSFNGATDASFEGTIFIRSTSSGSYNFDLRFNIWSQNIDTALTIGAITGDIIHKVTFKLIIQGGSFLITGLTQFAESAFTYGFEINPAMTTYTATGTSALGIQAKVSGTGSPTLYMTSFVLKQIA